MMHNFITTTASDTELNASKHINLAPSTKAGDIQNA